MTVILVLSRNTVTSLAHRGTVPHHRFDFFYFFLLNYFVQLEDTKIKTEHGCSMQRTDRTRVLHHSSLGLHCRGWPDQISPRDSFPEYNAVTVSNSDAIWTGAGSLTISRSRRPFRTAYLPLFLSSSGTACMDSYARAARMFYLRGLSTTCSTMLRAE